jgi:ABC-2 type transport system permease protein
MIASKEFSDLIRSNIMIAALAVYIVLLLYSYYTSLNIVNHNFSLPGFTFLSNKSVANAPGDLINVLCGYGGLVAVMLGLSSMYNEVSNRALNTLTVKPVYRDTILNGKLLGAVFFALLLFVFTSLADISLNFIFWGTYFSSMFPGFLGELPLVLICYLLVFMMFYLLTVLMFLLFNKSSLAFFLAFIAWIFIYRVLPSTFSLGLASFFSDTNQMNWIISSLSPYTMLNLIFVFSTTSGIIDTIQANYAEFFKLLLYVGVFLVSCYSVFLRRDVA